MDADALLAEFRHTLAQQDITAAFARLLSRLEAGQSTADGWRATAQGLIHLNFPAAAVSLLETSFKYFPEDINLRYWLGNALRLKGEYAAAEKVLREVLANTPTHLEAATSLAFMLREHGRYKAAAEVIWQLWKKREPQRDESLKAARFLRECEAFEPALDVCTAELMHMPDDIELLVLAGEIALALGRFELAQQWLQCALANDKNQPSAWLRLAQAKKIHVIDDLQFKQLNTAWQDHKLSNDARICVGFALGKALDDMGNYARAVDVLTQANGAARQQSGWIASTWQRFVEQRRQSPPLPINTKQSKFCPIFIIGLPRTGTTLVASILERHFAICNRGELNWIATLAARLEMSGRQHDLHAIEEIAEFIAQHMRRDDDSARFYIDKNPLNFRHLDFILALFPHARIIHCRRNPRDTALSIWMQHFAHTDLGFAYDFSDIAAFSAGYEQLMLHWKRALPLSLFEIGYESLVLTQTHELQRLAQFLDIDAAMLTQRQEQKSTAITTASVWQARQSIYSSSVGRWHAYASFLPALEALFPE